MAISITSLFLALMILANNVDSQGDVTSFHIDSFGKSANLLSYERDAFVPSGSTHLRLTATNTSGYPLPDSVGRVLYSAPVNLWEPGRQASFETTIKLLISRVAQTRIPADGMTFFIVPVGSTLPTGGHGGNLGIFDAVAPGSNIFAVEFDISVNDNNDRSFRHIGIDINSKRSANVMEFEEGIGQFVTARISYNAPTRRIDVVATYGSQTSTVSYAYDLKTLLPQQVQIGLSATTGPRNVVALFDVFSWSFTSSLVWDDTRLDHHEGTYSVM